MGRTLPPAWAMRMRRRYRNRFLDLDFDKRDFAQLENAADKPAVKKRAFSFPAPLRGLDAKTFICAHRATLPQW